MVKKKSIIFISKVMVG